MSKKIEPFTQPELDENARTLGPRYANLIQSDDESIKRLGERVGFGRMMSSASSIWRQKLAESGIAGGEFAVGPCVSGLVKCGCTYTRSSRIHCDWCLGAGWLTRKVREVQIEKGNL